MNIQNMIGPNSEPCEIRKCFGIFVPVPLSELALWNSDLQLISKARKHEAKLLHSAALKCNDQESFKHAARIYISAKRTLIAGVLESNRSRQVRHRLSPRQILSASDQYNVLKKLDEPVRVYRLPKSSGVGYRAICDFGPVARGAQQLLLRLFRATTKPATFQFNSLGVRAAIEEALRLIAQEDMPYVAEIDITNHYPSFDVEALIKSLPAYPPEAIRQIAIAASATWEGHPKALSLLFSTHLLDNAPSGIPQGSAASTAIADWSTSRLEMFKIDNTAIVNFADNFYLFAKNEKALMAALEALRLSIAKLPGGVFNTKVKQATHVGSGFRMLGCWIELRSSGLDVSPTDANLEALHCQFALELQAIEATLLYAPKAPGNQVRLKGVQAYLRLRSWVTSWASAYSFCADSQSVRDDLMFALNELAEDFGINSLEAHLAKDSSVEVRYKPYGFFDID